MDKHYEKLRNITDLLEIVPCSRAHLYKAAREQSIPTVKIGGRIFIPGWYFEAIANAGRTEVSNVGRND